MILINVEELHLGRRHTLPNRAYLAPYLRHSAQVCSANALQTSDTLRTLGVHCAQKIAVCLL